VRIVLDDEEAQTIEIDPNHCGYDAWDWPRMVANQSKYSFKRNGPVLNVMTICQAWRWISSHPLGAFPGLSQACVDIATFFDHAGRGME